MIEILWTKKVWKYNLRIWNYIPNVNVACVAEDACWREGRGRAVLVRDQPALEGQCWEGLEAALKDVGSRDFSDLKDKLVIGSVTFIWPLMSVGWLVGRLAGMSVIIS